MRARAAPLFLLLGTLTMPLGGCFGEVKEQVVQVEVPSARSAPPETLFKGRITLDWAIFDAHWASFDGAVEAKKGDLLRCLRSEAAAPVEVWVTGRVGSGKLSQATVAPTVRAAAGSCVLSVLAGTSFPDGARGPVSILLQAEPTLMGKRRLPNPLDPTQSGDSESEAPAFGAYNLDRAFELEENGIGEPPTPSLPINQFQLHFWTPDRSDPFASHSGSGLKVGGVGFPALDAARVARVLEAKGWRTMSVETDRKGESFSVFAVKKDSPLWEKNQASSSLTVIDWAPVDTTIGVNPPAFSEGFKLVVDGHAWADATRDLFEP